MRAIAEEDHLGLLLGHPVQWCLCPWSEIGEYVKHFYGVAVDTYLQLEVSDASDTSSGRESVEISTYVRELICDAVRSGATDIHLEPYEGEACLRYRIDGVMTNVPFPPGAGKHHRAFSSAIKVLAQMDIAEHRLPQDGRFTMSVDDTDLDLRVSVLPTRHGEAVELRILNRETTFINLDALGMTGEQQRDLEGFITQPNGITFYTGPTGSGKTTSLYGTLARLNDERRKIVTIEDPVEYQIRGITQLQVHADIGFTFASGLRAVLRHDPDVILIGEIRDVETATTAIRSSLTGHLVFSTLHTNDAPSALIRLVDMGIEPYLVASSVRGVVAQRLVRCICPTCRQERELEPWEHEQFASLCLETETTTRVQRGAGCPHCRFTGHRGRCAIFEVMVLNDAIRSLVVDRAASSTIMDQARKDGLMTLRESGWIRVTDGTTTPEEILRVTGDPG
jgi:type II secretory ATPase GspE/PulE/Tfp pilus assembly ATPase PilB-like protein